jgi:hypothetical protein
MAMIFAAGGLTSMIGTVLMGRAVITDAEQLVDEASLRAE